MQNKSVSKKGFVKSLFFFFEIWQGYAMNKKTFWLPFQDFGFETEERLAETELWKKIEAQIFFIIKKKPTS